jgi:outer membrane protein assembly factor BamB
MSVLLTLHRNLTSKLCMLVCGFVITSSISSGIADEWPMRGRSDSRNAVVPDGVGPTTWRIAARQADHQNILWSTNLGSLSSGDPVVSDGLVWIGTNNDLKPQDEVRRPDGGVLMCLDARNGKILYQYFSARLPGGHDIDWPNSSQSGSPLVEKNRLWFCNNRREVICLDIGPLLERTGEPKLLWKVDMIGQLGIVPRAVMVSGNTAHCSVAGYRDWIYVNTTNAMGYTHIPAPDAPSLICLEKVTGKVKWQDHSPGKNLLDVQHGSPMIAEVNGQALVMMGQGDGWVRAFDALTGELRWKFDINFKSPTKERLQLGKQRNDLVAMPVFHDGRVYFATGRHWEHGGNGPGRLCCIDPTKTGDISSELDDGTGNGRPNPQSGLVWEYLKFGAGTDDIMHRTGSSPVIHNGMVMIPDYYGLFHCVDAKTGAGLWTHDLQSSTFSSPIIVGARAYICAESQAYVFEVAREKRLLAEPRIETSWTESSPAFANGVLYLMLRDKLYAIREK